MASMLRGWETSGMADGEYMNLAQAAQTSHLQENSISNSKEQSFGFEVLTIYFGHLFSY